jgi:hypothetical protein
MNDIYYYLILGVLLYFLFTYILERFSNLEQENFDPSLVPVSSIVTLAKVAQKLVNGNGTLTNPGNLQIGIGNGGATGNLKVTGSSTFGSTIDGPNTFNVSGTAGVSGDTAIGGKLNVTGDTTVNSTINIAAGSENKGIKITSGNPYISFTKTGSTVVPQIYSDGTILHAYNAPFEVDQNLTVKGKTTIGNATDSPNTLNVVGTVGVSGDTALGGALTVNGISTGGELAAKNYTTNSSYKFIPGGSTSANNIDANALNLYAYGTPSAKHIANFNNNGSTEFFGNVTINDRLKVNGLSYDSTDQSMIMNAGFNDKCLVSSNSSLITTATCNQTDPNQFWIIKPNKIVHVASGKCITGTYKYPEQRGSTFVLEPCDKTNHRQSVVYNSYSSSIVSRQPTFNHSGWIVNLYCNDNVNAGDSVFSWDYSTNDNRVLWVLK